MGIFFNSHRMQCHDQLLIVRVWVFLAGIGAACNTKKNCFSVFSDKLGRIHIKQV